MTVAGAILTGVALVLLLILVAYAVALMEAVSRVERLTGDLLMWHLEKIEECDERIRQKPPDDAQAPAHYEEYRTPLARRSAEQLKRRRIEAVNE